MSVIEAIGETVVTIFVSLGMAVAGIGLALAALFLVNCVHPLGDLGIGLLMLIPPVVGILLFLFTFKKIRDYISH